MNTIPIIFNLHEKQGYPKVGGVGAYSFCDIEQRISSCHSTDVNGGENVDSDLDD